jgi:hypothetical protein
LAAVDGMNLSAARNLHNFLMEALRDTTPLPKADDEGGEEEPDDEPGATDS